MKRASYGRYDLRKANYGKIANTYDSARPLLERNLELWLEIISKKICSKGKVEFLDLGCGTGRFSIPVATRLGYFVIGADSSREMLSKAEEKGNGHKVDWIVADAVSLPYPDASFEAVFMSHLLHHVDRPLTVVKECCRVLRSGGTILNRYGAIENIRDDPEHRFFPESIVIDKARTPTVEQVEEWFRVAGFKQVSSETILQQTYNSTEERLENVRLKSTSVLTLISQTAFGKGLERLQKYVSDNVDDPWLVQDKITITTGSKQPAAKLNIA